METTYEAAKLLMNHFEHMDRRCTEQALAMALMLSCDSETLARMAPCYPDILDFLVKRRFPGEVGALIMERKD